MSDLKEEIMCLKNEKKAVILAHCYQNPIIDEVADFVGDSLYLSQMAANSEAELIVFAGVSFMAQTAKIISYDKKVLIPTQNAGCKMADMIDVEKLQKFKDLHPSTPVVCYINSTAEVKSISDICCTSSNALKIVNSLDSKQVLFVPDENLSDYIAEKLPNKEIIPFKGYCPIHKQIMPEDVAKAKIAYPQSKILAHPECVREVRNMSDFVGSTSQIMKFVENSSLNSFIIVTEDGVTKRLKRDYPNKEIIPVVENLICEDMKRNGLKEIRDCLRYENYEIIIDKELAKKAVVPIRKMLEVSNG